MCFRQIHAFNVRKLIYKFLYIYYNKFSDILHYNNPVELKTGDYEDVVTKYEIKNSFKEDELFDNDTQNHNSCSNIDEIKLLLFKLITDDVYTGSFTMNDITDITYIMTELGVDIEIDKYLEGYKYLNITLPIYKHKYGKEDILAHNYTQKMKLKSNGDTPTILQYLLDKDRWVI